jgi:hypothetical protein
MDDHVFLNIRKPHLHNMETTTTILPCSKVIGWIIDHVDVENKTIFNHHGRCITYFCPSEVEKYDSFTTQLFT